MPGPHPPISKIKKDDNGSRQAGQFDHGSHLSKDGKTFFFFRHFSIRDQIYLGTILVFFFALVMILILILNNNRVQKQMKFLGFVNDFSLEIQQARRYEKNYFLYGTNLDDALENIHMAESIFIKESEEFSKLLGGKQALQKIPDKILAYKTLLEQLYLLETKGKNRLSIKSFSKEDELKLRGFGRDILTSAQLMAAFEKANLEKTLFRFQYIYVYSFLILLVFLAINSYLLVIRLYSTFKQITIHAKRVSSGDFRPIILRQKVRDEFTGLLTSINDMLKKLDLRDAVMIQDHKIKAVGTLTAGVAHEINNPLNNIMLTVHMLLEDYNDLSKEEKIEMLGDIAAETDRSKKIIRNLLDFARESASTMESVDLSILLKDTLRLLESQIRLSGVQVDLRCAKKIPKIHGDAQKLQQVFINLLLNAMDASIKGDKIQVTGSLGDKANSVKVSVADHGEGIPKDLLPFVFDPFFTTKSKGKGTGLGLSVSQGIIAKHGGNITVESREGRGACFTLSFPIINFPENSIFSS
ncbi:MAG: GHKL domain-containing protein [Desulfobacteraceae bacterium]|nr:GHKL domain-containing protein [Desulfobacteraceae bacterium]